MAKSLLKTSCLIFVLFIGLLVAQKQIQAEKQGFLGPAYFYIQAPNIATKSAQAIIAVNTGGQAVNIIKADINFNANKLQAVNLNINPSVCPLIISQKIDNKQGKANITCAQPTPGFKGDGWLAQLDFVAIGPNWAKIGFDIPNSCLLTNNGLATNILETAIGKTIILPAN